MFIRLILPALLVLAPGALAQTPGGSPANATAEGFRTISSKTFASDTGGGVLVDVREPAEWEQTGVPEGARRVASSRTDFVDAVLAELGGDKSKPVAVICRSGSRSLKSAEKLVAAGFTNVTNVGDGMIGRDGVGAGWIASELPITSNAQ